MAEKSAYPGIKAIIIVLMTLGLLIPVFLLNNIVSERRNLAQGVEREIAETAGGELLLAGPVLIIPADVKTKNGFATKEILLLPEILSVIGDAKTEIRKRGIYSAPVYEGNFAIEATFSVNPKKILESISETEVDLRFADARVAIDLADIRALREKAAIEIDDGRKIDLTGGLSLIGAGNRSLSAPLALKTGSLGIRTKLKLGGGGSIRFLPLGTATAIKLSADWLSPSFEGPTAPSFRDVGEAGFTAEWAQVAGGGAFPQVMENEQGRQYFYKENAFGVELFTSVGLYHKSERALKYAILFIIIPFLVIYLFELFARLRIHPIQYAMVGFADVVFYALLLSISERLPFGAAYWLSAGAVTALIALYASSVLDSYKKGLPLIPLLGALYLYLYSALLSEDYALLIGSVGVFIVLALVMYATRKIDWYAVGKRE